jgi:hypothetical protein
MPFIISRADAPSKLYAVQDADHDIHWRPNRNAATRFTEDEAEAVVLEFGKYSDIDLDIEGAKEIEPMAEVS